MRRCITCEGLLEDSQFAGSSPICRVCVSKLKKEYHVEYSPPERKSVREAYVELLIAIRARAVEDGKLEEWEDYWLRSDRWRRFWGLLQDAAEQDSAVRAVMASGKTWE